MKNIFRFAEILLLTLSFIVCKTTKERPTPGGEIRIAWTGGLIGADPIKDWGCGGAIKIIRLIYSPLYSNDNPELSVAKNFSHSSDYTEWEFTLRKDCFFHNDPCFAYNPRRLNAYDVKYTYDFAQNIYGKIDLEPFNLIKELIVLDSFCIKFVLKRSDKNFINRLNKAVVYIIPPEAKEKYGENFSFHPVGSGPFCFESWNEKELVLRKNKNFWAKDKWGQKIPYVEKVIIKFFGDINQCFNGLLNNEVDISPVNIDVGKSIFEKIERGPILKSDYNKLFQIVRSPFPVLTILILNSILNSILKDPLIRKAINYGIDREQIIKALSLPFAIPAYGPTLRYFCGLRYEYDPQKAKELLKKAGYKNGLSDLILQHYPNTFSREIAQIIQFQLAKIGIRTKLSCASRVKVLRGAPVWDFDVVSVTHDDSTPSGHLHLYYKGSTIWVDFRSATFDSLWELYDAQPDSMLLCKMDSLVLENPPFVYLYWSYPFFIAKKGLQSIDPLFYISPYTWWKNE